MRRLVICASIAAVLALSPLAASASAPTILHYTIHPGPTTIKGVCAFDFTVSSVIPITETDYFASNGAIARVSFHTVETDTFVGPGASLTTIPYTYEVEVVFDAAGNLASVHSDGVVLKLVLPNGSLFLSAGRVDDLVQNVPFIFVPNFGRSGNMTAFCAALHG